MLIQSGAVVHAATMDLSTVCVCKLCFSQQHKCLIFQMRLPLEEAAFVIYIFAQGCR